MPQVDLEQHELREQVEPLGQGDFPKEFVDLGSLSGDPCGLEPLAGGVLPTGVRWERVVLASGVVSALLGAHPASDSQASRMVLSRRMTVRLAQPESRGDLLVGVTFELKDDDELELVVAEGPYPAPDLVRQK